MKRFVYGCLATLMMSVSCYAAEWQSHWESAVEYCGGKNYEAAETEFNLAISSLEHSADYSHPHVYVDRARLYLLQDRYTEALVDVNKALESKALKDHDRIRGLVTRIFTCSNLQMDDQVLADYDSFKSISTDFPKVEFTKDKVIIRNVPKSNCYKKLTKAFLVSTEICDSEDDIKFLDSGIMIAKRKENQDCGCGCGGAKKQMNMMYKGIAAPKAAANQQNIDNCKWWCDKSALAGVAWCAKVFKAWHCQTGCIFAVDLIKDGCHWCCKDGSFYQKCIKPFEDIVSYMGQPCDPYWD